MNLRQVVTTGVAGIILTGMSLTASQAQFAQFKSDGSKLFPGLFTFTNSGANSTLTANTKVNFFFDENVHFGAVTYTKGQLISASLVFSAKVAAPASLSDGYDVQNLKNISIMFKDSAGDNLLTVSGSSTGTLSGQNGTKLGTLAADTSNGFTYTSSFLKFGPNDILSYNLSMPVTGKLGITKKYLTSFSTSSSAGAFDAVPEASTLLGFGSMLTGGGLLCLRRRKVGKTA